ncbi:hypothetical protein FHN55_21935 [Streptomyces sp. NP160]|uniref:hypothetical protein n=1 Tax=Streptomyces sp. NP160 TaxID=2586637 RepID=UPI0011186BBE|nr:hypothetical protein [Streptomyces sp. NP160]TNM55401.1 hypothetical protein FHN55_21935 [Streptomyces sp. NP160]
MQSFLILALLAATVSTAGLMFDHRRRVKTGKSRQDFRLTFWIQAIGIALFGAALWLALSGS